jgi:hypothetical protein
MMKKIRWGVVLILLALATIAGAAAQTPATGRIMREKLVHSQRILEAILSSNFGLLERETVALARATETPAWAVLKGPEYMQQSEAFLKALRALDTAAKERDLDTAVKGYTELTLSCFACHRYMKDRRLAD